MLIAAAARHFKKLADRRLRNLGVSAPFPVRRVDGQHDNAIASLRCGFSSVLRALVASCGRSRVRPSEALGLLHCRDSKGKSATVPVRALSDHMLGVLAD
jgi:hypothetical protein